jgi:hypothetical protein
MTEENKNAQIEIYKSEMERFNATREIQWKFNIAIWTLLALAIEFFAANDKVCISCCLLIILLIICGVLHFIFIRLVQGSLRSSKNKWNEMRKKLGETGENTNWSQKDSLWVLFQIGITIILLIVLFCVKCHCCC